MKPIIKTIIKEENQDTILTKDITEQHIVVAVVNKFPCFLTKSYFEPDEGLSFQQLNFGENKGNGYSYSSDEYTSRLVVEHVLKNITDKVAVFKQDDWKQALQWLIDNA